jgi:prepilin-type N-terminal cleavage/methylation domain-containing protein
MSRTSPGLSSDSRRARAARGNEGFTMIEVVVSILIAAIAFTALAFTLVGVVKASSFSRENQQAGDVLNQAIEKGRALGYDGLAMVSTDLNASDSRSPALGTCACYNPVSDSTSGTGVETLAVDAAGGLSPHVSLVSGGTNLRYTLKEYVTKPTDSTGASYKRLTAVATWSIRGKSYKRVSSTLVAPTQRGLPLPDFKYTVNGASTLCRNPNSTAVYAFTLKNNGARDSWSISASGTGLSWNYYTDVDNNQSYDSSIDTALPTDSTTGLPATGLMEPTQTMRLLAVAVIGGGTPTPTTYGVTFTAQSVSVSDPAYAQTQSTTTLVQSGACTGAPTPSPTATASPTASASPSASPTPTATASPPVQPGNTCTTANAGDVGAVNGHGTLQSYTLHNAATNTADTVASSTMPFDKALPTSTTLWRYSTDYSTEAGRLLAAGGTSGSGASALADWRYQLPGDTTLKGDASVLLYVAGSAYASVTQTVQAQLDDVTSGTTLSTDSYTGTFTCATGFTPLRLKLSLANAGVSVAHNDVLRLRVWMSGTTAGARLAYDTTGFPSVLDLPLFSGNG